MGYGILDSSLIIVEYSGVDWKKNIKDKKNTSSACFFIGDDCLVA